MKFTEQQIRVSMASERPVALRLKTCKKLVEHCSFQWPLNGLWLCAVKRGVTVIDDTIGFNGL